MEISIRSGTIVKTYSDGTALVEIPRSRMCAGHGPGDGCALCAVGRPARLIALNEPDLGEGTTVMVEVRPSPFLPGLLVFLVPLLLFLVTLGVSWVLLSRAGIPGGEPLAAMLGLASMALWFLILTVLPKPKRRLSRILGEAQRILPFDFGGCHQ